MNNPPLLVISKFLPEYSGAAVRIWKLYESLYSEPVSVICGSTEKRSISKYKYQNFQVTQFRSQVIGNIFIVSTLSQIIFGLLVFLYCFNAVKNARTVHIVDHNSTKASAVAIQEFLELRNLSSVKRNYHSA